jgi:hypothetical protein
MKNLSLLATALITLHIATAAQAGNIIRANAPVIESKRETPSGTWLSAEPSYGDWSNNGSVYGCSNWSPDPSGVVVNTAFTQTATDCQQDQVRTVQAREVEQSSGIYRDVGQPTQELRIISTTAQRQAVGSKEYWVMISPTYTEWENSGELYGCSSWAPSVYEYDQGVAFTQTANDCKQDQQRQRQDRSQETTTQEIRNEGVAVTEQRTLNDQTSSREAVGERVSGSTSNFYRILIHTIGSGSYAQMVELEFLDINGNDLFDQYSVIPTESSFYTNSYKADKLIDNQLGGNKWTSSSGQHLNSWVAFKFPSSVDVKGVTIQNYTNTAESARQPTSFSFQYSNDNGLTWSTVKTFSGLTWTPSEKKTLLLN